MTNETQKLDSKAYEIRKDGTKLILFKGAFELFNPLKEAIDQKETKAPHGYILRMFEYYQGRGHLKESTYLRKDYLVSAPFFDNGANSPLTDRDYVETKYLLLHLLNSMNKCIFPAHLHALASYYMFEFIPYRKELDGLSPDEVTSILHELEIENRDDLVRFYMVNPYFLGEEKEYWRDHINIDISTIKAKDGFIPCVVGGSNETV